MSSLRGRPWSAVWAERSAGPTDRDLLDRFAATRDEQAFAALVRRYAPLVFGVARRVVGNPHDADDVLQATFLALARKPRAVRDGAVGGWLHSVARRLAGRVLSDKMERVTRERRAAIADGTVEPDDLTWREVRGLIDEELAKLPERLRAPLVLCYLQGLTQDEAAHRLDWKPRTLKARLDAGRKRLRDRLARRGLPLSAALTVPLVGEVAVARPPDSLVAAVLRPDHLSARVHELAHHGVSAMWPRLLLASAVAVLVASGVGLLVASPRQPQPTPPKPAVEGAASDLPPGAELRLGSPKFRHPDAHLALSADGKQLITFSTRPAEVRVWETATGKLLREVRVDALGHIPTLAWAPDGKTFATMEMVQTGPNMQPEYIIQVRDAKTGAAIRTIATDRFDRNHVLRYLDNKRIAAQTDVGIAVWDATTGEELARRNAQLGNYTEFGASADGKRIAMIGAKRGEVLLWDWEGGTAPTIIQCGKGVDFRGAVVSPDGKRLALTDGWAGPIRVFDTDGKPLRTFQVPDKQRLLHAVVFTPDGKRLIATDNGRGTSSPTREQPALLVWDVETGELEKRLDYSGYGPTLSYSTPVAVSADGKVVGCAGNGFPAWELATGKRVCPLTDAESFASTTNVFAGGGFLLTVSHDQPARLWDAKTGRPLFPLTHSGQTRAGALSPDGTSAAVAAPGGRIEVWDTKTGKAVFRLPGHGDKGGTTALRFTPDGKALISFGTDFSLRVTDIGTGKATREFDIRPAGVDISGKGDPADPKGISPQTSAFHAVLSADGTRLCVGSDTKYHVYDTATGKETDTAPAASGWDTAPAFTPDCTKLLTMSWTPSAQVRQPDGGVRHVGADVHPLACWDLKAGKEKWVVLLPKLGGAFVTFAPDGATFAYVSGQSSKSNEVSFHSAATGRLTGKLERLPSTARNNLAFTPDGKKVAVVMADGTVLVYPVPGLQATK